MFIKIFTFTPIYRGIKKKKISFIECVKSKDHKNLKIWESN